MKTQRPPRNPLVELQGRVGLAVRKAIAAGKLTPPTDHACADCGRPAQCYDHRDYSKPLEVQPVCKSCNAKRGPAVQFAAVYALLPVSREDRGRRRVYRKPKQFTPKPLPEAGAMTVDDLIAHFGSATKAAKALEISRPLISMWKVRGIPLGRQALIQIQTRGRLRCDKPELVPHGQ